MLSALDLQHFVIAVAFRAVLLKFQTSVARYQGCFSLRTAQKLETFGQSSREKLRQQSLTENNKGKIAAPGNKRNYLQV